MLDLLTQPAAWTAFLTLTGLELVLGIDNIVFISILADKLPPDQRRWARRVGLFLAMFIRIALLTALAWVIGLTQTLVTIFEFDLSGRDLILMAGGVFLIWKSTMEVHQMLEGSSGHQPTSAPQTFSGVIMQILIIDAVFSLDSIITAVGMVNEIAIMISAIVCSVALMMVFAEVIGNFVSSHPTVKMLALSFLCMIGMVLVADGLHHHVPRGYIYFAMAFSICVEMLNLQILKKKSKPGNPEPPGSKEQ